MRTEGSNLSSTARKVVALTVTAIALAGATAAHAYQPAPGWTASDYATGFAHGAGADGSGPVGVVFDANANLLVADMASATLHKVPPGGGTADSTKLRGGYGQAAGLTFDKAGRLYMARGIQHDVVELNP